MTKTISKLPPFQTQAVRDLAWSCFSPALIITSGLAGASGISDCQLTLDAQRLSWLEALDRNPAPLQEYLQSHRSHRLGLYFEALWHFFLQQDERCELLAHNLAVHDGGRTLGEFDCLYRCLESDRTVHLELAVKFFLRSPRAESNDPDHRHWLGPDVKDRLDLKIDHLLNRQIRLADLPVAAEKLAARGISVNHREIALRGYLFTPAREFVAPTAFSDTVSLKRWLRLSEWRNARAADTDLRYKVLHKMRWLSPVAARPDDDTLDTKQLADALNAHFAGDTYPVMVAALDRRGVESDRFFVTADNWPAPRNDAPAP